MQNDTFNLTSEQTMIVESAERFVREVGTFEARSATRETKEGFSRDNWATYAELGWLGLTLPGEAGGIGGSFADLVVLMQTIGPALLLEPLVASSVLAGSIIEQADDLMVRSRLLNQMVTGELIVTLAHDEPCDGRRPEPVRAQTEGSGYRIRGTKMFCWQAPAADYLLVTAHIDEDEEYSILLVDTRSEGITLDSYRLLDDTRAADVRIDNVFVDRGALILRHTGAAAALERAVDRAILALAAEAVGVMKHSLALTNDYLKARVQFGQTLSGFQVLQHRLSEMFIHYQDTVSILCYATQCIDDRSVSGRQAAVSAAKVVIGEAARYVGSQSIQLHGAIGLSEEYRVGHYYRRFLVFDKLFGDHGFHLARYAQDSNLRRVK